MKIFPALITFLQKNARFSLVVLLFALSASASAQSGTYEKKGLKKSYAYVSLVKSGNQVHAEIFTWLDTPSGQTGYYNGKGALSGNTGVLKSDENEPECKVTLKLLSGKLQVTYANCAVDHLPADFNGVYTKITDATAGDYVVIAPKAYFHEKANEASKLKSYVVKGDKVQLEMENITPGNWVLVSFVTNDGRETRGFIPLAQLKKVL